MGIIEKRETGEAKNVLKARTPVGSELLFQHLNKSLSQLMLQVGMNVGQRIKRNRIARVAGVYQHHVVDAFLRDKMQQFLYDITMGIHKANAVTVSDILPEH